MIYPFFSFTFLPFYLFTFLPLNGLQNYTFYSTLAKTYLINKKKTLPLQGKFLSTQESKNNVNISYPTLDCSRHCIARDDDGLHLLEYHFACFHHPKGSCRRRRIGMDSCRIWSLYQQLHHTQPFLAYAILWRCHSRQMWHSLHRHPCHGKHVGRKPNQLLRHHSHIASQLYKYGFHLLWLHSRTGESASSHLVAWLRTLRHGMRHHGHHGF